MFTAAKEMHFCYGHRIVGHKGKCKHLHGHSARVIVELAADELNALGMVMDFEDVSRLIKGWIDRNLDHRLILSRKDSYVAIFKKKKEPLFLTDNSPTAEVIAKTIYDAAKKQKMPVIKVTLWETPTAFASYSEL